MSLAKMHYSRPSLSAMVASQLCRFLFNVNLLYFWLALDQCQSSTSVQSLLYRLCSAFKDDLWYHTKLIFYKDFNFESLSNREKHENVYLCLRKVNKVSGEEFYSFKTFVKK